MDIRDLSKYMMFGTEFNESRIEDIIVLNNKKWYIPDTRIPFRRVKLMDGTFVCNDDFLTLRNQLSVFFRLRTCSGETPQTFPAITEEFMQKQLVDGLRYHLSIMQGSGVEGGQAWLYIPAFKKVLEYFSEDIK